MQTIKLPDGGFTDGRNSPVLCALNVAIGFRGESHTELFVRGTVRRDTNSWRPTGFAGTLNITATRNNAPRHDLAAFDNGFPSVNKNFIDMDDLVMTVLLALDAHAADLIDDETQRILNYTSV